MLILESEGHCKVEHYSDIQYEACFACQRKFELDEYFEPVIDRVRRLSYLIHPDCWDSLVAKLKGEEHANLPAWAQS